MALDSSELLGLAVEAFSLFWLNLQADFDRLLGKTFGTFSLLVNRVLTLDIDPPGGIAGLFGMGVDTASTIIDETGRFIAAFASGPFYAIAQTMLANFRHRPLGSKVVTLDRAVSAVGLLFLNRARNITLNPGSIFLTIIQRSLDTAGWQKKLADMLAGRLGEVLRSRVTKFARSVVFFILQAVVIGINLGVAMGMVLIVLTIKQDAEENPDLIAIPSLRQTKRRRYLTGYHRTREVSRKGSAKNI